MSEKLPDLQDFQLFLRLHKAMKKNRGAMVQQKDLAEEVEIPKSTLSNLISELEERYPGLVYRTREGIRLTPKADEFALMCEQVLGMVQAGRVNPAETKSTTEIRIITTTSLRARLFPGPVSAFMMWLHKRGQAKDVRVTVDAVNHDDLLGKIREQGYYSYHFGVCWELPQNQQSPYVQFEEMFFKKNFKKPTKAQSHFEKYGVPIVGVTSLTDDGIQPDRVKRLFHSNLEMIAAEDFVTLYDEARVAAIKTEPEDKLRILLTQNLRENSVVRVDQYEEVLHHVRSMDCDIGWAAAWFGYRKHLLARILTLNNEPVVRPVKVIVRKSEEQKGKSKESPMKDADDLVRAFYVIFKLFYSDPDFYCTMFGQRTVEADFTHAQSQQAVREWINKKEIAAEIDARLKKGVGEE